MFGKLMSISDELMWRYFELLSFPAAGEKSRRCRRSMAEGRNPRDVKFELAGEMVARFHEPAAARGRPGGLSGAFCAEDAAHRPAADQDRDRG